MSENNAPTSLLSSCIACKAKCCKANQITVTEVGYQKIVDAGHPDHFHKIDMNNETFYVLDHRYNTDASRNTDMACQYLQDGKCSIEDVKPDICAAYPMVSRVDWTGFVKEIVVNPACPAAALAEKIPAFKEAALKLTEKINSEISPALSMRILNEHNNIIHAKRLAAASKM